MKNILIAAGIIGGVTAAVIYYMKNRSQADKFLGDIADAAKSSYNKLNKQAAHVERKMAHSASSMS